jgi:hypothetical protein
MKKGGKEQTWSTPMLDACCALLLLLLLLLPLAAAAAVTSGDHLEVLPHNPPHMVDAALQLLGLQGEEVFDWTPAGYGAARGFASHAEGVDLKVSSAPRDEMGLHNAQSRTQRGAVVAVEVPAVHFAGV